MEVHWKNSGPIWWKGMQVGEKGKTKKFPSIEKVQEKLFHLMNECADDSSITLFGGGIVSQ